VTFLYFENIYNLTHRSKALLENSIHKYKQNNLDDSNTEKTTAKKTNNLNSIFFNLNLYFHLTLKFVFLFIIQSQGLNKEKNIKSDNKNSENLTKCWDKEPFTVLEICSKCSSLLKSSLNACHPTGYREVLNCEKYGPVSRRFFI
jgi:hypothetical protein